MRYRILGPIQVRDRERDWREVPGPLSRGLLAELLLNPNSPVTLDRLAELLWDGRPPRTAHSSLHNQVHRLRRLLDTDGHGPIRASHGGYVIDVAPGELDTQVFAELCGTAAASAEHGDWARTADTLRSALAMWRGEPVADSLIAGHTDTRLQLLREARVQAWEQLLTAEAAVGDHALILRQLGPLLAEDPLRESFHGHLMLALYRSNRRSEALDAFQRFRRGLVDELGLEPARPLRELHQRILAADPELDRPAAAVAVEVPAGPAEAEPTESTAVPTPAQLPPELPDFVGRDAELDDLAALYATGAASERGPVVSVIAGMGGLGKTALAVRFAHRIAVLFPDGQVFFPLRGSSAHPLSHREALEMLLRTLSPHEPCPPSDDEAAARLRTVTARRRLLFVFDDARDAAQLRPLIPGGSGCGVIVTSRGRLPGIDGRQLLDLDLFDDGDAGELLARIIGPNRVAAEPDALAELVRACAGLPLALRICGARLSSRRHWALADMAARLGDARRRLPELAVEDLACAATFEASLHAMREDDGDAARAFHLLSVLGGPDFGVPAAAAALDVPPQRAQELAETLVDVCLLTSVGDARYGYHDLLRDFARSGTATALAGEADAAARRWTEWARAHLASVQGAIDSRREPTEWEQRHAAELAPAHPGFAGADEALAWFDREHAALPDAAALAAGAGLHQRVVSMALCALHAARLHSRTGMARALARLGLVAAQALDELELVGVMHNNLGLLAGSQADYGEALRHFGESRRAFERLDAPLRLAMVGLNEAITIHRAGDPVAAAARFEDLLVLFDRMADDATPDAARERQRRTTLLAYGEALFKSERYAEALAVYRRLQELCTVASDDFFLTFATGGVAQTLHAVGDLAGSLAAYESSAHGHRATGNRDSEAIVLTGYGKALLGLGRVANAAHVWSRARELFELTGNRRAIEVETLLGQVADAGSPSSEHFRA